LIQRPPPNYLWLFSVQDSLYNKTKRTL
jgi:hypothetical protein